MGKEQWTVVERSWEVKLEANGGRGRESMRKEQWERR